MVPSRILQSWPEVLMTATSFLILVVYHLHLFRMVRKHPLATSIGITDHVRRRWIRSVMEYQRDILAVQTLRNHIMAATFLASTAMIVSLGVLSAAFRPAGSAAISHALNLAGARSETLWMFKLLLMAVLLFFAFFNFTLAVRYYNHAGLMINIDVKHDSQLSPEIVTDVLNHGALHYTFGMRGFYLAVPVALWLFGPLWMLGGTIALVIVLYQLDREV
jgi:uncharacterized membrane protein